MDKPQLRFLLRGSLALIAMLGLWWLFLLDPMLATLRVSASIPLSLLPGSAAEPISQSAEGDWTLQVPVGLLQRETIQRLFGKTANGAALQIRFVRLKLPKSEIAVFTVGLPLYWAILLAAGVRQHQWRVWLRGTGLLAVVAMLSLLVHAGYTIETRLQLPMDSFARWILEVGEYLAVGVLPYVAPCLIALWLATELRGQVFSGSPVAADRHPDPLLSEKARRRAAAG